MPEIYRKLECDRKKNDHKDEKYACVFLSHSTRENSYAFPVFASDPTAWFPK